MALLLPHFLRKIGYVLLERHDVDRFTLASEPPSWFMELWPASKKPIDPFAIGPNAPFLQNFLEEAETFWKAPNTGVCESGKWIEKTHTCGEIPLEAEALYLGGKAVLAIHSPEPQYREQVKVLQTARNALLEHERLLHEITKKEILLHCIVHDLSQPLSAMRGSFDCLVREHDPEHIAKFIDLGKNASERQESMIREILKAFATDMQGSLDSEEGEKSPEAVPDLLLTAKEALTSMAPAFEAKGVKLSLGNQVVETTNWHVRGEKTRLLRVFTNLLENALRYTPAGSGVTIGMEEDGGCLKAYIDDEGPGLPPDLRPAQIFAMFAKGKESGGKAGLGLYFCRITVERWGGSIGCSSLNEIGSRFWFRLPRAVSAANPANEKKAVSRMHEAKNGSRENRTGLQILLADDQEDIRSLTTHQLTKCGHQVVAVANGQAALESAQSAFFDVILLDEEMPMLNGPQVAAAIRENQKNKERRSVLVALTGNNTEEDKVRLLAAGFDSVLGKPFRLESLDAFLRDPLSSGSPADESSSTEYDGNLDSVLQRVGGDEKLLRQMIRTFLRETPNRMAAIQKALQRRQGLDLSTYAHALKGSVSIFEAHRATQHTQSLQDLGRICDFQEADRVFGFLQEEIAKLQQNLRRYAKLEEATRLSVRGKESRRPRPAKRGSSKL